MDNNNSLHLEYIGTLAVQHHELGIKFNAALERAEKSGKWPGDPDYPSYDPQRMALLDANNKLRQAIELFLALDPKLADRAGSMLSGSIRKLASQIPLGETFEGGPLAGTSKYNAMMYAARVVEGVVGSKSNGQGPIQYDNPIIIGVDYAKPDKPIPSIHVGIETPKTGPQVKHAIYEWFFGELAQSLFHWNGVAEDGDRGRDNNALVITIWDDGSGQVATAHTNPDNVNGQYEFGSPEQLADWLTEWMDDAGDPPPTAKQV